jgi:hypothetical protein
MKINFRALTIATGFGVVLLAALSLGQIAPDTGLPSPLIDVFAIFGVFDPTRPDQRIDNLVNVLWCLLALVVFPGIGGLYAFLQRRSQPDTIKKLDILLGSSFSGLLATLAAGLIELVMMLAILLQDYRETVDLGFSSEATGVIYGLFISGVIVSSILGMFAGIIIGSLFGGIGGLVVTLLRR